MLTDERPQDRRDTNIERIYKEGTRSEPRNYRQVSLACILCMVLERTIKNDSTDHLAECSLVNSSQYGSVHQR